MLTLKEKALLAAVKEKTTLKAVIDFCHSNNAIADVCYYSKKFWLIMLPKVGEEDIALLFEPLKERYWQKLIQGLLEGKAYQKSFIIPDGFFEPGHTEKIILHSPLTAKEIAENYFSYDSLMIRGIRLPSGTSGWVISIEIDAGRTSKEHEFMLASKEGNDIERIIDFVVNQLQHKLLKYYKYIPKYYIIPNHADIDFLHRHYYRVSNFDNSFEFGDGTIPNKAAIRTALHFTQENEVSFIGSLYSVSIPIHTDEQNVSFYRQFAETSIYCYKAHIG